MTWYWIFDEDDTPQGFPLQRLMRAVRAVAAPHSQECEISKVRGHGESIARWDGATDAVPWLRVKVDELERLSAGTEEWFHDIEARFVGTPLRFGIHDSSAMFLVAEPIVAQPIIAQFAKVRERGDAP